MLWNPRTGTAHLRACRRGLQLQSHSGQPVSRYCGRCFQPADAWLPQALLHRLGQRRRELSQAPQAQGSREPAMAGIP